MGETQSSPSRPAIEKMIFTGGHDNRRSKPPTESGIEEGTWSMFTLTINPDGTWASEEQGGHEFEHDRAIHRIQSSGTWNVNESTQNYEFTVKTFDSQNSDSRALPPKNGTGKVFTRFVADIHGDVETIVKSFFHDGEMKRLQ